jgi:hypothetical protein
VRIGEVTRKTGLSARMIRYYEHRGRIRSAHRRPRTHHHYADDDIERLRVLRALLAPVWHPPGLSMPLMAGSTPGLRQHSLCFLMASDLEADRCHVAGFQILRHPHRLLDRQ